MGSEEQTHTSLTQRKQKRKPIPPRCYIHDPSPPATAAPAPPSKSLKPLAHTRSGNLGRGLMQGSSLSPPSCQSIASHPTWKVQ
jgi:hypothetical protein